MLTAPTGAPTAYQSGIISTGTKNNLIKGLDCRFLYRLNGSTGPFTDLGYTRKLGLIIPNTTEDYKIGQPQGIVLIERTEQGFGIRMTQSEQSIENLGLVSGQPVQAIAGTPYTITAQPYQFDPNVATPEGNQYITLPDGVATGVSITSNPAGTSYAGGGAGHDYLVVTGAAGSTTKIIREPGGALTSGEAILVTGTFTPVASKFINVSGNTSVPTYNVILYWKNAQTQRTHNYQHSSMQFTSTEYMWEMSTGGSYMESTMEFRSIQDNSFLDPNNNVAQYGVVTMVN